MPTQSNEHYGLYEAIVAATNSEVILFFVIVAVVMGVVVAPLYYAILKERKATRKDERERDERIQSGERERDERILVHERENRQQIIDVVKENSAVIARLTTTLDNNGASTVKALERIHTRLDTVEAAQKTIATDSAQINTKFDNTLRNQTEITSKINKIFVKVHGGNLPPDDKGGATNEL